MSSSKKLKQSFGQVTKMFEHDLSAYDLQIDEVHDTVAVTARYTYDLAKVYDLSLGTLKISIPNERVREKMDEFLGQVHMGIEHDILSKFPHLQDLRPITYGKLKSLAHTMEALEFERLANLELSTTVLRTVIRARLTQASDQTGTIVGTFQHDVTLSNEITGSSENLLFSTQVMPFPNSEEAEIFARRFIKSCQS